MKWFVTSDLHFGHSNIIRYCNRPQLQKSDLKEDRNWINKDIAHERAKEMDSYLIDSWNSVVGDNDMVIIVGDFCLCRTPKVIQSYLDKLNGKKILVLGNHDYLSTKDYISTGFQIVTTAFFYPDINGAVCVHDPTERLVDPDRLFLTGHVHNLWKEQGNAINVGVDVRDFKPVLVDTLIERSN